MSSNVIFFAWDRPIPGREQISAAHFQEFIQYLGGLQQAGTVESFEAIFLNPHGGDLNGLIIIRGEPGNLAGLTMTEEWNTHMTRATLHAAGAGAVLGATGDLVMERFATWASLIPE